MGLSVTPGKLALSERTWQCAHCRTVHGRDDNAAVNIDVEGLRIPYGTLARSFVLSGNTVFLTLPDHVRTDQSAWIRYDRFSRHAPLGAAIHTLRCGNRFRFEAERLWRKWLGRRSWRGRMTWDRFARLRKTYPLPAARVVHGAYR